MNSWNYGASKRGMMYMQDQHITNEAKCWLPRAHIWKYAAQHDPNYLRRIDE